MTTFIIMSGLMYIIGVILIWFDYTKTGSILMMFSPIGLVISVYLIIKTSIRDVLGLYLTILTEKN